MVKEEIGRGVGALALVSVLAIMIILLAVLALVVVQALAKSPWGVFTIATTIPVALIMGVGLAERTHERRLDYRFRSCWVWPSASGADNSLRIIRRCKAGSRATRNGSPGRMMIYGFAASILPVWMLLTPRDYLSTFLEIGNRRRTWRRGRSRSGRRC